MVEDLWQWRFNLSVHLPMRGLGTDHEISGPVRRLEKKTASNGANGQIGRQTVNIPHLGDTDSLGV